MQTHHHYNSTWWRIEVVPCANNEDVIWKCLVAWWLTVWGGLRMWFVANKLCRAIETGDRPRHWLVVGAWRDKKVSCAQILWNHLHNIMIIKIVPVRPLWIDLPYRFSGGLAAERVCRLWRRMMMMMDEWNMRCDKFYYRKEGKTFHVMLRGPHCSGSLRSHV